MLLLMNWVRLRQLIIIKTISHTFINEKKEDELKSELLDDKYPYPTPIRVRVGAEDNRNGKRR